MKNATKLLCLLLALMLLTGCTAAGDGNADTTTADTTPADIVYQFDCGFSVTMPRGFRKQQSQLNDFFGTGDNGTFAIIANVEPKSEYESLENYAQLQAEANDAGEVQTDAQGNYYITYSNSEYRYHYYSTIREGAESYYRIAFYCPEVKWESYEPSFIQWSSTLTVK